MRLPLYNARKSNHPFLTALLCVVCLLLSQLSRRKSEIVVSSPITENLPSAAEKTTTNALHHATSVAAKLMLTAMVLLLCAMFLFGQGASALFTSVQVQTQSVGSGAVTLALGTTATSANRLALAATGLAPGDTMQRPITLLNSATVDFAAVALTTVATTSTVLNTDPNGLVMTIDECSVAWTESGLTPAFSYACSGSQTNRVASRAVVGAGIAIPGSDITAATSRYYVVTLTLPAAAPTTLQTRTSIFSYTFTATQRAGISR